MRNLVYCPNCGSERFREIEKIVEETERIYGVEEDGRLGAIEEKTRLYERESEMSCIECGRCFIPGKYQTIEEYLISLNLSDSIKEKNDDNL